MGPMGGARGQAEDIRVQAEQIMKIKASMVDEYAMMTGQTRERIEADLDRVNQIIAVMLFADSEDEKKPQYLYINSPGGSVTAGLAPYDTMGHVSSDVITVNVGMAASMGSFILGTGTR